MVSSVEFPTHMTDHGRMDLLVSWLVDHPQASQEEDARARREEVCLSVCLSILYSIYTYMYMYIHVNMCILHTYI